MLGSIDSESSASRGEKRNKKKGGGERQKEARTKNCIAHGRQSNTFPRSGIVAAFKPDTFVPCGSGEFIVP